MGQGRYFDEDILYSFGEYGGTGRDRCPMAGKGIPLGVLVVGANVHDSRLIGATLKNTCEMGAWFLGRKETHLCLDKAYDCERVHIEVYVNGFNEYIHGRGEDKPSDHPQYTPRRWHS